MEEKEIDVDILMDCFFFTTVFLTNTLITFLHAKQPHPFHQACLLPAQDIDHQGAFVLHDECNGRDRHSSRSTPNPRSILSRANAWRTLKFSATLQTPKWGRMIPPEPMRMCGVTADKWPRSTSGLDPASQFEK